MKHHFNQAMNHVTWCLREEEQVGFAYPPRARVVIDVTMLVERTVVLAARERGSFRSRDRLDGGSAKGRGGRAWRSKAAGMLLR